MFRSTMTTATPDTPYAYLANGLIGLTVPRSPLQTGELRVNGCFGLKAENKTEWIAVLPYPLGLDLWVNDRPVIEHAASFVSQELDFATGELSTKCAYSVGDLRVELSELRICSRANPAVAVRRASIRTSAPCRLRVRTYIDADRAPGAALLSDSPVQEADTLLHWETEGKLASCGMALTTVVSRGKEVSRRVLGRLSTILYIAGDESNHVEITQMAAVVPSILHEEPHWQALRLLRAAQWRGFDEVLVQNRRKWEEIWKSRIVLAGAGEDWQRLADAAYFYLFSSAHAATPCSIPPFALSASGYGGHIFWDTDTFMYPVFLLAAPDIARALVSYRTRRLAMAEANARLSGYGGAMFPWESGLTGSEVTPVWADTSEEHHIGLDVAFACIQHAHASGDDLFVRQEIWPLLAAVCRWLQDRVVRTPRGYEIHHVVGVDEGTRNVNNNSYTNIGAKVVLEESDRIARGLGIAPPAAWREIADAIFVPVDKKLGIILKHDAYEYTGGPCVPETLGAFFPFTYRHPDRAVEERTYRYHLDLADTVLHFPMLSSLFGVWAARRGERDLALHCFTKGIREFACDPFWSFTETRGQDRPLFLTNPAGFLTACMYGLTGIQLDGGDPTQWGTFPIVMPTGWDGVEVERIWVRGRPARLSAHHGDKKAQIRWLDGKP
jgi:protein-glucosylgalactosylhydroxylysine glucosidase